MRNTENCTIRVTADVWSSRAQSYLGMTVHFLNHEFKRESYVLAFKQLHTRQTYKELALAMDQIFDDYNIKKSQIRNIVTDGGSNFCKMFKMYGRSMDATVTTYDHEAFDDVEDGECENEENLNDGDGISSVMSDMNGEPFVNEILSFDNESSVTERSINGDSDSFEGEAISENDIELYFGDNVPEDNIRIKMPPQRRCVSHILNLLSNDFEKKYLNGHPKTALCQTLSKLHSLWVLIHRSTQAKSICIQILGKVLKVQNDTRWNSRFDAVKMCSETEIQKNLNKLIQQIKAELKCVSARNLQMLNIRDFSAIDSYINVLEPVAIALDIMQREFNCSQGFIFSVLDSMRSRIKAVTEKKAITEVNL